MGGRTWTDTDLRDAAAQATSWRGVLRLLGLNSGSGGSLEVVRRRADQLGLDTTHFLPGPRRWSDQDLAEAISLSDSWDEVANRIGLSVSRRTEIKLKGHALQIGLDSDHLQPRSALRPSVDELKPSPRLSELRTAAPTIISAWFRMRGVSVAIPSEPEQYDLLITAPDGIKRVQVKSTTRRISNGTWRVEIGHRPYSLDKTAGKIPYDPETLDFFPSSTETERST